MTERQYETISSLLSGARSALSLAKQLVGDAGQHVNMESDTIPRGNLQAVYNAIADTEDFAGSLSCLIAQTRRCMRCGAAAEVKPIPTRRAGKKRVWECTEPECDNTQVEGPLDFSDWMRKRVRDD